MLSLRYAIRQVNIELVSALQALKMQQDGTDKGEVCFSRDSVSGIPVIVKRNTLLFQTLEKLYAEEGIEESKPTHEVITKFLNDLAVVIWPQSIDRKTFMDRENMHEVTGADLRRRMFLDGFYMGDEHMVPLLAGAGMSRSGKYLFIREKLRADVLKRVTLGLISVGADGGIRLNMNETYENKNGKKENVSVNPAKLLAYVGLADSDGVAISELRAIWNQINVLQQSSDGIEIDSNSVVVVPDVYGRLGINAIGKYVISNDNSKEKHGEVSLRKLTKKDEACLTDGYGFINPEWSRSINRMRRCRKSGRAGEIEGFENRAFVIRLPYIKGALVECDYILYLKEFGVEEITDLWGKKHPLDGVKIILTESMFKGAKFFKHAAGRQGKDVWEYYCSELKKMGLSMIITGSDSEPTGRTSLNYQFLSSMQPDDEALHALMSWEMEQHKSRLKLLKGPGSDGKVAFAKSVIRHLKDSVRVSSEQQIEQLQEDLISENEVSDEDTVMTGQEEGGAMPSSEETGGGEEISSEESGPDGDASYAELLAHLLETYPEAAFTRAVMEEIASVSVKAASDASQGRVRVKGQIRMLCGDPFVLLNRIAEDAGAFVQPVYTPVLQSEGMIYAPGLDENELLMLRNPHVSVFEAITVRNLRESDAGVRAKYKYYFGEHVGIAFINSAVASNLGGADFDGDKAKLIWETSAVNLAKGNVKKIYKLLQVSGDDSFKVDPKENVENKVLPIVSITPFEPANLTVEEMNKAYWEEVFESYLKSIDSKVGIYSVRGATLAFNRGMVSDVDPENAEQTAQAIAFLKTMARLTTVIGLDIDSAKSGKSPEEPVYGKLGERSPLLKFSRYCKQYSSSGNSGLKLYKKAYEAACEGISDEEKVVSAKRIQGRAMQNEDLQENTLKAPVYDLLKGTSAAARLVTEFGLCAHYDDLQRWEPLRKGQKKLKNEMSFIDVICRDLEEEPDEAMTNALGEVRKIAVKANASRSAASRMMRITEWILQRRVDILQYLMRYYPLSIALKLNRSIAEGIDSAAPKIDLEHDSELIRYAFCEKEERRKALKGTIFGREDADDSGFEYDETCIQLAKYVQRLRTAHEARRVIDDDITGSVFVPVSYAQQKAQIIELASRHGVDRWKLGCWMLKKGLVREKDFVLLFVGKSSGKSDAKEEKNEQPNQGGE